MRHVVLLTVLLVAATVAFALVAPPTFAARDQAHADLLGRERDLLRLETELGRPDLAVRDALLAEHAELLERVTRRSQVLAGAGSPPPRLPGLLQASPCAELRAGGGLHEALLVHAGLAPAEDDPSAPATPVEQALARLVEALAVGAGAVTLESLDVHAAGALLPVRDLGSFRRVELQLVLFGPLPELLDTLERLAPSTAAGPPQLALQDVVLRRIDPSRWGENLHLLESPPVRASATLDALFPQEDER
jgi:hypothetical protein